MPTPSQMRTKPLMHGMPESSRAEKVSDSAQHGYEKAGKADLFGPDDPGAKGHPREKQGPERRAKDYYPKGERQ